MKNEWADRLADLDNTETSLGAFCLAVSDRVAVLAAEQDTGLKLHGAMTDLSLVLKAYAARCGVERTAILERPEDVARAISDDVEVQQATREAVIEEATQAAEAAPVEVAPAAETPAPEYKLPDWLAEGMQQLHERLAVLEAEGFPRRVASLEQRVADLEAALERMGEADAITPSPTLMVEKIDPEDYRPESWNSIDRARQALRNQVGRAYSERTAIRQTVLNAVTALADLAARGALDDQQQAELAQQRERADRLAQLDVNYGVKLDEIAALDDLDEARKYDAAAGWAE